MGLSYALSYHQNLPPTQQMNEKGQVVAKSSLLKEMESDLVEEQGLRCCICLEGYRNQPQKVSYKSCLDCVANNYFSKCDRNAQKMCMHMYWANDVDILRKLGLSKDGTLVQYIVQSGPNWSTCAGWKWKSNSNGICWLHVNVCKSTITIYVTFDFLWE